MRTIGILGGMGPAATLDFYGRLIALRGAGSDEEHPPCLLNSATQIPDRTNHIVGVGPDPAPALIEGVMVLEAGGAEFIAIPCNTAHAYLRTMREAVGIPVLDMIAAAVAAVQRDVPDARQVGILATTGTLTTALYDGLLHEAGCEPLHPEEADQSNVMEAIHSIKGGSIGPDARLSRAALTMVDRGARAIIMGCTEIPLGLDTEGLPVRVIDATQALAEMTLSLALEELEFDDVPGGLLPWSSPAPAAPDADS
jgi:aspartate racemase